jgi:hypothetical protein
MSRIDRAAEIIDRGPRNERTECENAHDPPCVFHRVSFTGWNGFIAADTSHLPQKTTRIVTRAPFARQA